MKLKMFYDYLGSLRFTMKSDGTLLNFKTYSAYGETLLDTLGFARQGYIGKEKDVENGLGDHGVRKYDYETGRFNSFDSMWELYYGWSPYHYSMNNPISSRDGNGLLVENPDGSLKSTSQDKGNPSSQEKFLFTEKSNQKIPAVNGSATNCVGYALTGEFHWDITTKDGMKVINEEYNKVNNQNDVNVDDVIVYNDKKGNPIHFGRITEIKKGNDGNVVDMKYQWTDGNTSGNSKPNKTSVNDISTSRIQYGNKKLYSRTFYRKKEGLNEPRELEEKSKYAK